MHVKTLCEFVKMGPSRILFMSFMHCNVWHIKNLCGANLSHRHLARINKTHAENVALQYYWYS